MWLRISVEDEDGPEGWACVRIESEQRGTKLIAYIDYGFRRPLTRFDVLAWERPRDAWWRLRLTLN